MIKASLAIAVLVVGFAMAAGPAAFAGPPSCQQRADREKPSPQGNEEFVNRQNLGADGNEKSASDVNVWRKHDKSEEYKVAKSAC